MVQFVLIQNILLVMCCEITNVCWTHIITGWHYARPIWKDQILYVVQIWSKNTMSLEMFEIVMAIGIFAWIRAVVHIFVKCCTIQHCVCVDSCCLACPYRAADSARVRSWLLLWWESFYGSIEFSERHSTRSLSYLPKVKTIARAVCTFHG